MTRPVLLTGASGFVGRHVRTRMEALPLGPLEAPVDLCDRSAVRAAVQQALRDAQPEWVLHLAAQSFVPESFADPARTFEVNVTGTLHLLLALKEAGFRGRMLYVGTSDAYGRVEEARLPVVETQPLRPRSPYAASKAAAELLCYQWSQTEEFEIVIARPFNHLGPGQSPRFAVASFAAQVAAIALGRRPPELVVGDLDVTRDYLDVRDVVSAYALLLGRGLNGEVYNVGSGQERSLRSLLETLLRLSGVQARLVVDPQRLRPTEQRRMCASPAKLRAATGWRPRRSLEDSLRDLLRDAMERDDA